MTRRRNGQGALKPSWNGQCAVNVKSFVVAAAIAASLTACSGIPGISSGSSTRPAANGSPVPSQSGTSGPYGGNPNSGDCLLGANGVDVQVGIADATSSCASWIQNLAGSGFAWYPLDQMTPPGSAATSDGETMQQACDLTDGTQELYVEDAGGQTYGDNICSAEEQNGWTPEASPGPLASQAEEEIQQQAQAQASEAQASSNAAAEQHAQNDLSTLEEFSLSSDLSKLSGDLIQTSNDLAAEKTAAAAGPNADGGDCYNLESNVDYDAEQNVEYDAQQNLGYDLQQNLVPDISSGRQEISTLQSDLSNLQSIGLPAPSDAQATIRTAQNAIINAVSAANADIGKENSYVSQAYSAANSIATGNCAGDGPGSPPSPIQAIASS